MSDHVYISNSTLSAWLSCGTRGLLYKHHRLTTPDERGHRTAGSAFHEAMAHYFSTLGDAIGAQEAFEQAYKPFSDQHLQEPVIIRGREVPNRLRYENLAVILDVWLEKNPIAEFSFEIVPELIEIKFEEPLGPLVPGEKNGPWIIVRGIMDAIVRDKRSRRLRVLDTKTTGRIDDEWWRKWTLESELTEYAWAASRQLGESKIDLDAGLDILVNGVEFSELPSSNYACRKHAGMKYAQCSREHAEFGMRTYKRTRADILVWGKNALAAARAFHAECQRLPEIADIQKADIRGSFHAACRWCDYKLFCELGRPPESAEVMLIPAPPSPFEKRV